MLIPSINVLFVILIFGSLILLSFLLAVNPLRVNQQANRWFSGFLFLWSTYWFEEVFGLMGLPVMEGMALVGLKGIQFLTPIVFYVSVRNYTDRGGLPPKQWIFYLIAPFLYILGLLLLLREGSFSWLDGVLNILIIGQAILYIILAYQRIRLHKKEVQFFESNTEEIDLKWIEQIIFGLFAMSVFIGLYNAVNPRGNLNLLANFISLAIIYFTGYNALRQKEIFLLDDQERERVVETQEPKAPEKRKLIPDEERLVLKAKLLTLMEQKEPYLDPDLSLLSLANLMDLTPHQLSYLINAEFEDNFFLFVNKYRVERVKQLLLSPDQQHLSIMGVAYDSGFNSKTSFYTTFKKLCHQTPSEFRKKGSTL